MQQDSPQFINAAEAARILNISHRAVLHRIASGALAAHKLPGRTGAYILNRSDVVRLAQERSAS